MSDQQTPDQRLADLESRYAQAQAELAESRSQLEAVERRYEIDRLLLEADAVDIEAARLLTEIAVGAMAEKDVKLAVQELRRDKPFLFRRSTISGGGAMAARPRTTPAPLDDAAEHAATSGHRRDLLDYLRLRRTRRSTC